MRLATAGQPSEHAEAMDPMRETWLGLNCRLYNMEFSLIIWHKRSTKFP